MHDIRFIRENRDAFDAGLARRGLPPQAEELIALDEARRAAVTVKAGGNPEPIVQAPFKGIQQDLAARGPLYIDDFKQGVSPKSLVSIAPVSFKR